jgi:chromate transporter
VTNLSEVIRLFFKLGIIAFGGPAAHIAIIHKEVVENRSWMDEEHFLDLVGATSLIPGPNSTEMVIHCGFHRAGVRGLFAAGLSFILPACLLTGLLAYLYTLAVEIPNFSHYMIGVKSVVIILIGQALLKLWKKAIKSFELAIVAAFVLGLGLYGVNEVLCLLFGAILGFTLIKTRARFQNHNQLKSISLAGIFWVFMKIGSVLFGSGYVLIAYLQAELVDARGWLTSAQIADAIAIGQFTPGPVLSTSTFIGYLLGGGPGAVLASIGIFLPSFLFVLLLNPLIPKMRKSKWLSVLLDSVNASALGLMAYALFPLGRVGLLNPIGAIVFILCLGLVWKFPKLSAMKLVSFAFLINIAIVIPFPL